MGSDQVERMNQSPSISIKASWGGKLIGGYDPKELPFQTYPFPLIVYRENKRSQIALPHTYTSHAPVTPHPRTNTFKRRSCPIILQVREWDGSVWDGAGPLGVRLAVSEIARRSSPFSGAMRTWLWRLLAKGVAELLSVLLLCWAADVAVLTSGMGGGNSTSTSSSSLVPERDWKK